MEAILGDDTSKALKNYSVIFEKLLRLRQGMMLCLVMHSSPLLVDPTNSRLDPLPSFVSFSLLFWSSLDTGAS